MCIICYYVQESMRAVIAVALATGKHLRCIVNLRAIAMPTSIVATLSLSHMHAIQSACGKHVLKCNYVVPLRADLILFIAD